MIIPLLGRNVKTSCFYLENKKQIYSDLLSLYICLCYVIWYTINPTKLNRIFGIAIGDKTRAILRFAKIHSKAKRKPDFCDSESLAYTAGESPTLCVALRVRLRALPSAQDDISPALRVQMRTECKASHARRHITREAHITFA